MMNRFRVGWAGALATAFVLVLDVGCGGDDSGANYPDTGTDGTVQPESSTPRDGSATETSTDAATRDGGQEAAIETGTPESGSEAGCVVPDGGSPCDPGVVTCGAAPCDVPSNFCCLAQGTPSATETCDGIGTSCTGLSEGCDETGDCASGSICCFVTSLTASGVSCQAGTACSGGTFSIQICKTDAECDNATPCVPQSCMFE